MGDRWLRSSMPDFKVSTIISKNTCVYHMYAYSPCIPSRTQLGYYDWSLRINSHPIVKASSFTTPNLVTYQSNSFHPQPFWAANLQDSYCQVHTSAEEVHRLETKDMGSEAPLLQIGSICGSDSFGHLHMVVHRLCWRPTLRNASSEIQTDSPCCSVIFVVQILWRQSYVHRPWLGPLGKDGDRVYWMVYINGLCGKRSLISNWPITIR